MYHWSIVYKPWCKTGCLPYQHVTNHIAQINHTSFNQLIECSSLALPGQAGSWNLLRAGRLKLCICPWHLWQVVVLFFRGFTFFGGIHAIAVRSAGSHSGLLMLCGPFFGRRAAWCNLDHKGLFENRIPQNLMVYYHVSMEMTIISWDYWDLLGISKVFPYLRQTQKLFFFNLSATFRVTNGQPWAALARANLALAFSWDRFEVIICSCILMLNNMALICFDWSVNDIWVTTGGWFFPNNESQQILMGEEWKQLRAIGQKNTPAGESSDSNMNHVPLLYFRTDLQHLQQGCLWISHNWTMWHYRQRKLQPIWWQKVSCIDVTTYPLKPLWS